jgi:hypothetical protein
MKDNVFTHNQKSAESREEKLLRMEELGRLSINDQGQVTVNDEMMIRSIAESLGMDLDVVDKVVNAEYQYLVHLGVYEESK